jgi:SSS family solute:Na+ symporter
MNLHLAILLVYAGGLMGLGLWISTRVRKASEFFVAGRRLSPALLLSTMLAANIGAGSTVGAAALGYRDGLSAWWWVGSAGLGSIILAFWVGPKIRQISSKHRLQTVGDFLEFRYGQSVRVTIAVLLWFGTLAVFSAQLIAISWVLNVVTGVDPWVGCVIGGLVVTTYFSAGGLLAAAWINAVQLVVLLTGFVIVLPLALSGAGGWTHVVDSTRALEGYWNFWHGGQSGWFYLAMLGPAFIISPGLLQKVYGARDDRAVRIGVGVNALVLLAFAMGPPLLGMIARSIHPELPDHDLALPILLMDTLPPVVGALGLAALFSAEVSSSDAILFMLATSLSRDLYQRFIDPTAPDAQVLRVARGASIAGGLLGTLLAVISGSIIDALSVFYTLLSVSLFVPVLAGLYLRRVTSAEALGAIAAGVLMVGVAEVGTAGQGLAGFTPAMIGLCAAAAGGITIAVVRQMLIVRRKSEAA